MITGGMEAIYDDVPEPIGLMAFAPVVQARGPMFGATHRAHASDSAAPVVTESDLYGT